MITRVMITSCVLSAVCVGPLVAQSPTGEWDLRVEWPAGATSVRLVVSDSVGSRGAVWEGPQGRLTASKVEWTSDQLAFVLTVEDRDGRPIPLRFAARIDGDELRGELVTTAGRTISVTGTRAPRGSETRRPDDGGR